MGREAEGHAVWRGASGAVKAVLESDGIRLRGEVRALLPRAGLREWRVEGEDLCLRSDGEPLALTLGAREAAAWVRALDKPLPSLAAKLGVSPMARALVLGGPAPEAIAVALAGAEAPGTATGLRVWCVYGKGKGAAVGDAAVRDAFRAAGWIDIKACAVSEAFTATLYRPPV